MPKSQWVRVSKQHPCPVCQSPDWCSVAHDGAIAKCMRQEVGSFKAKDDKNGGRFFLHRLKDSPPRDVPPHCGAELARGSPDLLHEVYTALVATLTLTTKHRDALLQRGLPVDCLERGGYRTLSGSGRPRLVRPLHQRYGDQLFAVPGFVVKEGKDGRYVTLRGPAGLLVPCRDLDGRIVALKVRRDEAGDGVPRYLYVSSHGHGGPSPGSPLHVPPGTPPAAERVRLTEGELKADVIFACTALPTLAVPGVTKWRPALPTIKDMGCTTVRLAFDADAWDNPTVARALCRCAEALQSAGMELEIEVWDPADGKGLDDLLAASKSPDVLQGAAARQKIQEILASATAEEEPSSAGELARLHEVLHAGGAEALFLDRPLLQALADLSCQDPAGFAAVRASIRERVSLRELDKALRVFPKPTPANPEATREYVVQGGCIYRTVHTKEGPVPIPLCNFSARITEDVVYDDGAEQTRTLALEGTLSTGSTLPRAEVSAADFASMAWMVPAWGTRAVVYAGQGTRDHLRVALQLLSGEVPQHVIYRHLGWRLVDGQWYYLHGGGGIGAHGLNEEIVVQLPEPLAGFLLPAPLRDHLVAAVRASLGLLNVGPPALCFPLLCAAYRAVLGDSDFALHLSGPTGTFKSEIAALIQQHFGAGLNARHLPGNWSSTANALEALAFAAKDALFVVDDFCPTGSIHDVQRCHKEADRLFRGQGNRSGRQRLRADATLRPAQPPRGLTLSTGEDTPRGQSLRARLLGLEVSPGDLGPVPPASNPLLTHCQADAAAGKYALSMSGFLHWIAPQYETIHGGLRSQIEQFREQARGNGHHARTPGIVADLAVGLHYFLEFAVAVEAITTAEREELWQQGWKALGEAAAAHASQISVSEPANLFLRLLSAAIAGGYAHVADPNGNEPREPQRWGWRPEAFYVGQATDTRYKPQGTRVGWLDEGEFYLEPDASFAAVQQFARDQGDTFTIGAITLRKRLKEKGLLATTDTERGKLTVRKTLQGVRREVLHLAWAASSGPKTGPIGPIGPAEPEQNREESGSWADSVGRLDYQSQESAQQQPKATQGVEDGVGRLGRSSDEGSPASTPFHRPSRPEAWGDWK